MQSRTLAFANVLHAEWSKGSSSEVARLTQELSSSSDSLKVALDANTIQGEALRKAEAEQEALRVQLGASERRVRDLASDLKKAEDNFAEAISAHNEVVSEKARLDLDLAGLKDCVLKVHSQTFKQAIRQAVLLYGILEDNELDENKDVYNS